jgi:heat shock protein HslJ
MQQRTIFVWIIPILLLIGGAIGVSLYYGRLSPEGVPPTGGQRVSSPIDISFTLSGRTVTLASGYAEAPVAPGSASKEIFRVFGEPTIVDLEGDGDNDAIFMLTQDAGGSGTFFYVVAAVNDAGTYVGTNALFLGDRIAPQGITIDRGVPVVNFAERKSGESYAVAPSVGKSIWVRFDPKSKEIGEAVKNFEGEADAKTMTLTMKSWTWVSATEEGITSTPKQSDRFTLTFKDGQVSVTTDCNGMGGTYTAEGNKLTFGPMMSTLMYCEGSQEGEFGSMLGKVRAYAFTGKGTLELSYGTSGIAVFR